MSGAKRDATEPPRGVFVEAGGFRVDRGRALEKLMAYSLPEGLPGMLLWVRCAIGSGASRIAIKEEKRALEIRFDGRALSARELSDPFGGLFAGETEAADRGRDFALGILRGLRPGGERPSGRVTVISGAGKERLRLELRSLSDESVGAIEDGGSETVIRVDWPWPVAACNTAMSLSSSGYAEHCAMSPVPIEFDGVMVAPSLPGPEKRWEFASPAARARLGVPPYHGAKQSRLRLFCRGLLVKEIFFPHGLVAVEGEVNCDALTLTGSMGDCVRDEAFDRMGAELDAFSQRLVEQVILEQESRMPETGRLLAGDTKLAELWRDRFVWGPATEDAGSWGRFLGELLSPFRRNRALRKERVEGVLWDARVTAWLRHAAAQWASSLGAHRDGKFQEALRRAPIFFDTHGNPLSLQTLRTQLGRSWVYYSRRPGARHPDRSVVWCLSANDIHWLEKQLPQGLQPISNYRPVEHKLESRPEQ